ncbi:MAG: helix-turn-helix transcriptional regulator [Lachnospiraceae bacterium]|nr:helix-turn-helix transcriptional regulator [Lachnospiraceae bacterium]
MIYNYLDKTTKRTIGACNFNQHICSKHPDRILQEHDLLYVREGNWSITQDEIDYSLTAGDVILLQSGHHHYGKFECNDIVKTGYIHFSVHDDDCVRTQTDNSENFYAFPMVVHCGNNPIIERYFNRVIYSFWDDDYYQKEKAALYLELLLCELSSVVSRKQSIADEIKLQIRKTPGRFISVEEFAKMYNCSVRTISSKFKESTGVSLHAWQMQLKCRMADELMQYEPTITLKEVAATYGFYDEYHFGKCFKKIMGRSPKKR